MARLADLLIHQTLSAVALGDKRTQFARQDRVSHDDLILEDK